MKWIRMYGAAIALFGLAASADAGLFGHGGCDKGCGCAEDCQPECCRPTIARPCCTNVYTYQRKCSDIKPPCCDSCGAPDDCCAPAQCCDNDGCGHGHDGCCEATCSAPAQCCHDDGCGHDHNGCCEVTCSAPVQCCDDGGCGHDHDGCGEGCSQDDCCEIAQLIYTSMTACYAKDRRKALHKLGDDYDCCCHPEIMKAFICGLNDADERVRAKAADEIGDQLRDNRCCCSPEIVSALTCALGDCDRSVRRQAEEALEACGYEVVDGCCDHGCCESGCTSGCCTTAAPAEAPAPAAEQPAPEAVPAPAPPEEPQAYYPSRLRKTSYTVKTKGGLAELFGLAR